MATRVVSAPYLFTGRPAAGGEAPPYGREAPIPLSPAGGEGRGEGAAQWISDGAVALDGDTVLAFGPRAEVEAAHGPATQALDAVLLPALVNAHTHLELSHLRGKVLGGEGLVAWIRMLLSRRTGSPEPGRALDDAISDLQEAGVAAVGDVTNTLAPLPHLAAAGISGTLYHEVFGFSGSRIEASLAAAADARARAGRPPPGLTIAPSPHAVYSTNPRVLASLLKAGPASIHLAEDPGERAFCARMEGPFVDLLRQMGALDLRPLGRSAVAVAAPSLGPRSLVIHAVDLDDEDVAALAHSGATVVLCPRSNLHIGGQLPDLPRLRAAGIPLAVGTDSLASSPSLAPLAELAVLARAYPAVPAAELLPLAWNGAAVNAPAVGRLAPGAAPGVLAAPLGGARPDDPAAWLLAAFAPAERPFTWVAHHHPDVRPTSAA